jgi:FixJ family two-component response regulator
MVGFGRDGLWVAEPVPPVRRSGGRSHYGRMKTSNPAATRVLVADDQPDVREALRLLLKNEGYEIQAAASPAEILAALEAQEFDIVLMDLNYARDTTSGAEGLDLLNRIQAIDSALPLIVMTAWGSVQLAVEAMRRGARDFIQKPWENARLLAIVKTQVELRQSLRKQIRLEAENRLLRADSMPTLIAEAASMRPVLELIARWPVRCERPDHRRTRHRQGSRRQGSLRAFSPRVEAARHRKCRRTFRGDF